MPAFSSPPDGPDGTKRSTRHRTACPSCGAPLKRVRILYGYPTPETEARATRGEVVLAGCLIGEDDPKWACAACGAAVAG